MADVKNYSLRVGGEEEHVFTGRSPRQAALKAATRGFKDIQLREHGRKKDGMWRIHVFTGSVEKVKKPANSPDWMPDMINKPKVKKIRVDKIKEL
ncbi:chromosomal protein MC1 [Candidatus Altiarchaeales archaeon WOR_SM1_SCG]|nr:chromosomal protein MC1 [Candidatus Altiarchaeales archaeon WOR_SM1_SCG]